MRRLRALLYSGQVWEPAQCHEHCCSQYFIKVVEDICQARMNLEVTSKRYNVLPL